MPAARISLGASGETIAVFFWLPSSAWTSRSAVSSRSARVRTPWRGPCRTSAGLAPKNEGVAATILPFSSSEVERQVMALDAPAPLALVRRRAEDRQEVALGVAHRALALLEFLEHLLQAHDRGGLEVAAAADPRRDQAERQGPLLGRQLLDRDAQPVPGNEVPVQPLGGIKREDGLLGLVLAERVEEPIGSGGHPAARLIDSSAGPEGCADHDQRRPG